MRRRLRRQRRMREALLLDLGAIVFELHRQGRREPELLQAKAAELKAIDEEVRALADALDAEEGMMQLVAAGIAGSCENCGSLLSTDARYCGACGAAALPALGGSPPPTPEAAQSELETGEHEAVPPDPMEYEPMEHEPPVDEPVEDEPVEDEPAPDEPVEDEPAPDEPVEDEPAPDEPIEDEPVADEPTEPEPARRDPLSSVLEAPWQRSRQED
jgi:hypothetical protein